MRGERWLPPPLSPPAAEQISGDSQRGMPGCIIFAVVP
jgi:hypothetical protein